MKASGVNWIGEIGDEFILYRLKHLLARPLLYGASESGIPFDTILPRYIRITDISPDGKLKDTEKLSLSQEDADGYILNDKDILFARSGATVGKAFLYKKEYGPCAFAGYLIKASLNPKLIIPEFLFYYTQCSAYEEWKKQIFVQATIQNIGADKYSELYVPVPSLIEQRRITDFLSWQCANIDNVLERTKASIEEYKKLKQSVITEAVTKGIRSDRPMKDSGIEWIGRIAKDFHVWRMKHLLSSPLQYGASESGIPYEEHLPRYIRITDITAEGKLKESGRLSLTEESAQGFILSNDDILFARSGATVGKAFQYKVQYGKCAFAGYLIKAVFDQQMILPAYVFYYTQSSLYEEWKNQIFVQATIQNIGADKYYELPIVKPNVVEQQEIVSYLDLKCAEIDSLIASKEKFIAELESYKKSLIYEYVTGKKEVPSNA